MQEKIDQANQKLDKTRIIQRGQKLALRGTFPPKPGQGEKPKQYTISLGLPVNLDGIKIALIKAQSIEADLIYDRFSWQIKPEVLTVEKAIALFEVDYWATREKTLNRTRNYKYDYQRHFLYLPQDEVLRASLLKKALLTTRADSRERRGMAIAYRALLNHFEIKNDLNKYKGNYSPTIKRQIPTLEEIDQYYALIKSPQWRWVFGIIACYGIRPHEIFHLDCSKMQEHPPVLRIGEDTKTGSRLVYPLPDEKRIRLWKLENPVLPKIKIEGKSNIELGQKVSQRFWEYKIPSPYHFRDAYAIRGEILNYNPAIIAQWMGHDLDTHYKQYLRHTNQMHFNEAWKTQQSNFPIV